MNIDAQLRNWSKSRMSLDRGYFSGRGPSSTDLNRDIFEDIYTGIKNDVGAAEAARFVALVDGLKDLSAVNFINAYERFAGSGYQLPQGHLDGERVASSFGTDYSTSESEAFAAAMTRQRDNMSTGLRERISADLKFLFVEDHEDELAKVRAGEL